MTKMARLNRRREQLKRELTGLATGAVFFLTGLAFLFNQTLWGEDESVEEGAQQALMSQVQSNPRPEKPLAGVALKSSGSSDLTRVDVTTAPATSDQLALDDIATVSPGSKLLVLKDIIKPPEVAWR